MADDKPMLTREIEAALTDLVRGAEAELSAPAELTIIGGAAALITGTMPSYRTTADVDVLVSEPEQAIYTIESLAEGIAAERGLARRWLNSDPMLFGLPLAEGWRDRRQAVQIGPVNAKLTIYAIGRLDWIILKLLAGRDVDLDDLAAARVKEWEATEAERLLTGIGQRSNVDQDRIKDARKLLQAIERHPDTD